LSSATSIGPAGPLSMAELGRSLEGRSLGPYKLLQFVGGGGMGAVFRALDSTLDRTVAVKVLSRQQSSDEEMLKRFRNEAQSAARLDHENIGRVHAVGSDDGWHYIVFEYIEGENLRDVVNAGGPFDLARTIDVSVQIADALEHASERDVVHRDIKPSNIIITPTGKARIVDMGLARLHQVAGDQDLTASGMTLGTFDYISPEQARDPRAADVRSDLYSLGCTIFFMLAGRPPFAEGTMVQKLLQHQQDEPPAIETIRPDVPRRFGDVLRRLMKKDPAERYQRPGELIADLVAFADDTGIELSGPRPAIAVAVERPATGILDHLPWIVPVLGLAAVIGGLWLRSRVVERSETSDPVVAGIDGEAASTPAEGFAPVAWRVMDDPAADHEKASLADALQHARSGDVIELAYSGMRDEPPVVIAGKDLILRAAEGARPGIRFSLGPSAGGFSTPPPGAGGWSRSGCLLDSSTLRITGVALEAAADRDDQDDPASLFALRGAATLECVDAQLTMTAGISDTGDEETLRVPAEDAFVEVQPLAAADDSESPVIRMIRCTVAGDVTFCACRGASDVTIVWSAGTLGGASRFLLAEGLERGASRGPLVRLSLDTGVFACRDGFASLRDSPSRPVAPSLHAFAESCRFRIPDGRALIEQSGVGDPDAYRAGVEWIDAGGRYEGSGVFRRIDGAAERVEMDYASSPQPLVHLPTGTEWQDGAD